MGVITIIKPDGTTEYTVRPTHAYTGTCSTAAGTAAKTVTISPAISNFLEAGVRITVYFSNANTANNPTLSINSGTAKAIYKGSSAITKALLSVGYHDFIYDGTQWQYVSSYIDTNTTYTKLSSSNTNTLGSYVVKGAGANTGYFLRGDGEWKAPSDTTYDNISASNTKTNGSYTVPGAGSSTGNFLRGDGNWTTLTDTTYSTLNSASTSNGQYVVPGVGNETMAQNYILFGDGTWHEIGTVVPFKSRPYAIGEGLSYQNSTTIYYENDIAWNVSNQTFSMKFTTDEGSNTIIDLSTLSNGNIYYFVFRNGIPNTSRLIAIDEQHHAIPFLINNDYFYYNSLPVFPTNIVVAFKKTTNGLEYVGLPQFQTLNSNSFSEGSYLVNGAGSNTDKFLRGDGEWQTPTNTTYAKLSSLDTNTAGSYVVKGAGSNTSYFLRGDGTWMPKCAVGGSENASSDTYHKIYYESSVTNNHGLLYIKFKDRDGATLAISTLVNGTIYNFVFRTDTPAYATRFALKDDTTASAVSFMTSEGNEVWFGGKTMPLIPTNMVLQFKKDSSGLKYVGPSNLYNMLSSTNSSETLGHVVKGAGSNTGHFLRGDGEWKIPTDTTYAKLSSSNTNTAGSYVVKGAGSNTGYFLRGDGSWQPVSGGGGGGTTYDYISASNTSTNTSYVVRGAGANTDCFLRGDGYWGMIHEFTGATNTSDGIKGIVPKPITGEQYCALLGDGGWHTLPISNKIVQEFECDALKNASYPAVMNFVALKIQTALGTAIEHIQRYASTQEILFKFNGRMGNFDGQSELMLIEILAAFDTIARQFLDGNAMEYHITVNFEFTPHDKYYENGVPIPQVHIGKYNKFEIIETLDNDNNRTLAYDEKSDTLYIRELQGNFLNILTYRIDCHDVSLNPNVIQYSKGTQISLKQYAMIYHIYNPVVY